MSRRETVLAVAITGLIVVFVAAIIVSFSDQYGLALYLGWGKNMAPLLPATVDVYGLTTTIIWLAGGRELSDVQRHARAHAAVALALSVGNNIVYRAIEAHAWDPGRYRWVLVVIAAAIAPAAVGALAHLAVLLARSDSTAAEPSTGKTPPDGFAHWVVPAALLPASAPAYRSVPEAVPEWQRDALEEFADDVEAGRVPSHRAVKRRLSVGSVRATEVQVFLRSRART